MPNNNGNQEIKLDVIADINDITRTINKVQVLAVTLQLEELHKKALANIRDQLKLDVRSNEDGLRWLGKRYKLILQDIEKLSKELF